MQIHLVPLALVVCLTVCDSVSTVRLFPRRYGIACHGKKIKYTHLTLTTFYVNVTFSNIPNFESDASCATGFIVCSTVIIIDQLSIRWKKLVLWCNNQLSDILLFFVILRYYISHKYAYLHHCHYLVTTRMDSIISLIM